MLNKLMKYEMKATARYFLPIYAVILVFSLLIGLTSYEGPFLSLLSTILPTGLVVAFIGLAVITLIMVVTRFDRNLLSDEGYLMFTLPVKTTSLIHSKLIASLLWILISFLIFFFSIILISWRSIGFEFFEGFFEGIKLAFSNQPIIIILGILIFLSSILNFILHVYASLSIAQGYSITRSRILGGTIVFIAITTIFNILETISLFISGLVLENNFSWINDAIERMEYGFVEVNAIVAILTFSLIYITLKNILFYFLTRYHLNKKLNLE